MNLPPPNLQFSIFNLQFPNFFFPISKKLPTFAPSSCRDPYSKEGEGVGQLIGIASHNALFLAFLNVGNSKSTPENMAEWMLRVGILKLTRQCAEARAASRTLYGCTYILAA